MKEEGRELIYKSPLNRREGEVNVYLFDHALVIAKPVKAKQHEQYKVIRRVRLFSIFLLILRLTKELFLAADTTGAPSYDLS